MRRINPDSPCDIAPFLEIVDGQIHGAVRGLEAPSAPLQIPRLHSALPYPLGPRSSAFWTSKTLVGETGEIRRGRNKNHAGSVAITEYGIAISAAVYQYRLGTKSERIALGFYIQDDQTYTERTEQLATALFELLNPEYPAERTSFHQFVIDDALKRQEAMDEIRNY